MKMKTNIKKSLFLIATFSALVPLVVACSTQSAQDNSKTLDADQLKKLFADVSPASNPLETIQEDRSVKPDANLLTSLGSLNNLVSGDPFTTLGELPSTITMSATVSNINAQGKVTIVATFTLENGDTLEGVVVLKGFTPRKQTELEIFASSLSEISPSTNPLRVLEAFADAKLEANNITSLSDLDNLVQGSPFTKALNSLPEGAAMSAEVSETTAQGQVTITVNILKTGLPLAKATIVLQGFLSQAQKELNELASELSSLSPQNNPQQTTLSDKNTKPDVNLITSISSLDDLVARDFFSNNLTKIVPGVIFGSVGVSEITANGLVEISLLLSKAGLKSVTAKVYLGGFIFSGIQQNALDTFVNQLNQVSLSSNPLDVLEAFQTVAPEASSLTSVGALDALVGNMQFSTKLTDPTLDVAINATVSDISFDRLVTINLTITAPGSVSRNAQIILSGFTLDESVVNNELNRLGNLLTSLAPSDGSLVTTLLDRSKAPQSNTLNSLEDLDNFVQGNPFSDALGGQLQSWVGLEITSGEISVSGIVKITVTLKDTLNPQAPAINYEIFIGGFDDAQSILDRLGNDLSATSPQNNPLITTLSNREQKPNAASLRSLNDLDNLVSRTPFSTRLAPLPEGVTFSAQVGDISNLGVVKITITFSNTFTNPDGTSRVITSVGSFYLGGFVTSEERQLLDFAQALSEVSPETSP